MVTDPTCGNSRRNSGSFVCILGRNVRAPTSRLSLANHTGTTLCASTSWKGTPSGSLDATCGTCGEQQEWQACWCGAIPCDVELDMHQDLWRLDRNEQSAWCRHGVPRRELDAQRASLCSLSRST